MENNNRRPSRIICYFPNRGKCDPFQDVLILVNQCVDEMNMILKFAHFIPILEHYIDVQIRCEELLEIARESVIGLPVPANIMDISIQDALLQKFAVMADDLYPPVVLGY